MLIGVCSTLAFCSQGWVGRLQPVTNLSRQWNTGFRDWGHFVKSCPSSFYFYIFNLTVYLTHKCNKIWHSTFTSCHQTASITSVECVFSALLLTFLCRKHGMLGIFKGLEAKLLQTVLTAALMFLLYEKIVSLTFRVMGLGNSHLRKR